MFIETETGDVLNSDSIVRVTKEKCKARPDDLDMREEQWVAIDREGARWPVLESEALKLLRKERPQDTLIPASPGQIAVVAVRVAGKVTIEESPIVAYRVHENPSIGLLFVHAVPIRQFDFPQEVGVLLPDGRVECTWHQHKDREAFAAAAAENFAWQDREYGRAESDSAAPEAGVQVH